MRQSDKMCVCGHMFAKHRLVDGEEECGDCADRGGDSQCEGFAASVEPPAPDYSSEESAPPPEDSLKRLTSMVVEMARIEISIHEIEEQLAQKKREHKLYAEGLIPELMTQIGVPLLRTSAGIQVETKTHVHASFPKDEAKREEAFAYLRATGNDGVVKRVISVSFGRDEAEKAEKFHRELACMIDNGALAWDVVGDERWIEPSTLKKLIKDELARNPDFPLKAFGAYQQTVAEIKVK